MEYVGNNDDRFDLSLDDRKQEEIVCFLLEKFSYVRVVIDSVVIVNARYFLSCPLNNSSTSLARNRVKFVGNDDSEHPRRGCRTSFKS